jgi:hypothetical protein
MPQVLGKRCARQPTVVDLTATERKVLHSCCSSCAQNPLMGKSISKVFCAVKGRILDPIDIPSDACKDHLLDGKENPLKGLHKKS